MPTTLERLQRLALAVLRPVARVARAWLIPPPPTPQLTFCRLAGGPARGCLLQLPAPTELSTAITSGEYESACVKILNRLVKPTDLCVDIGGHYGFYTVTLARLAAQGFVHTYEPVARLASSIEASLRESNIANASVHHLAVAADSGEMDFRYAAMDGGDDSMGYLVGCGGVATPEARVHYDLFDQTRVRTTAIDDLGFDPDFIKVDAEGAESEILRGGMTTLGRKRPRLLIELHGIREALSCEKLLAGLGYRGFCIEDRGATVAGIWIHAADLAALAALQDMTPQPPDLSPDPSANTGPTQ